MSCHLSDDLGETFVGVRSMLFFVALAARTRSFGFPSALV